MPALIMPPVALKFVTHRFRPVCALVTNFSSVLAVKSRSVLSTNSYPTNDINLLDKQNLMSVPYPALLRGSDRGKLMTTHAMGTAPFPWPIPCICAVPLYS